MKKESVFPSEVKGQGFHAGQTITSPGLTKRELFAAMAMQGLCANSSIPGSKHIPENLAAEAIMYADELLKQLEL